MAGKILVIRGGAIGDFILTLPVLSALRKAFPQNHLEVLGYPHIARLASIGGLADAARSIEAQPLAGFFARNGTLQPALCDYFDSFHLIISFLYDPDEIFRENIQRCSKAQFIAGPHRPDETQNLHATEVFLKPLERLAIFDAVPTPRLNLLLHHSSPLTLACHPGSGSEKKNWPEEKWAELFQKLVAKTSFSFLLVGGEAEGEKLRNLAQAIPRDRLQLAENLPLPELAEKLKGSKLFIGHDSGITHLAAALDLPGVVLWGPSKAEIWHPRSDKMKLLRSDAGLASLRVDDVAREVLKFFAVA